MQQLRGVVLGSLAVVVCAVLAYTANQFFRYDPLQSEDVASVRQEPASPTPVGSPNRSQATNALQAERIRRLQSLLRTQQQELRRLRQKLTPAEARSTAERGSKSVADLLPEFSELPGAGLLTPEKNSDMTPEERLSEALRQRDILQRQLGISDELLAEQALKLADLEREIAAVHADAADAAGNLTVTESNASRLLREAREVRQVATRSLASLGPDAVPPLLPLLHDKRQHIREWVAELLEILQQDEEDDDEPKIVDLIDRQP